MHINRRSRKTRLLPRLAGAAMVLVTAAALTTAVPGVATAGATLPGLVSVTPLSTTPNVFPGDASTGVDSNGCSPTWFGTSTSLDCLSTIYSETVVNGEVIVGGAFTQACQPGPGSTGHCTTGTLVTRDDVFAYSLATGAIDPDFVPQIDQGPVFSVAAGPPGTNTVYLGGSFTTVNGTSQRGIAQVNVTPGNAATDGSLVTAFKGHVSNSVDQIALGPDGTSLYLGGQFTTADSTPETALARFNATTGAVDTTFSFTLSHPENNAALKVESMALSPDGSHLVIGGTFLDAANSAYDGGAAQSRPRMAVLATAGGLGHTAALTDFTAPILANNCSAEHDYVRGLDFGQDGSYLVMAATGFRSAGGPTICDAVSRWNLTAASNGSTGTAVSVSPTWINFAGGDSFYAVDSSGPVIYAAGHNRWVNNQCGVDSLCAPNAVLANGVAALDANTGLALPWWQPQTSRGHGTLFLSTFPAGLAGGSAGGLMLGTDVNSIAGAFHGETATFPAAAAGGAPGGPIPSGIFNENGGTNTGLDMCINEAGNSGTPGAAVQLANCDDSPGQNWTESAGGTITINGLCLDTQGGGTASGTKLVAATCSGSATQNWAQGSGNTLTSTGAPGKCLDDPGSSTTNGVQLDIATCSGGSNQVWPLPAAQGPPAGPPTGPVFSPLIASDNEMCMDDAGGSSSPGTAVDFYTCNGTAGQAWTINTSGTITIHGLCVGPQGGGTASGTPVILDTCTGGSSQVWTVGSNFSLVNKAANLCLTDPGSSLTKGTQLTISSCNGGKNEQWRLPAL